jgi:hypothetical protein
MPTTDVFLDLMHALDANLPAPADHLHNAAWSGTLVLTTNHHHQISRADLHRSHHLTGQADDLHESPFPEFSCHGAKDPSPPGVLVFVE